MDHTLGGSIEHVSLIHSYAYKTKTMSNSMKEILVMKNIKSYSFQDHEFQKVEEYYVRIMTIWKFCTCCLPIVGYGETCHSEVHKGGWRSES